MPTDPSIWKVIGQSVRGASHLRSRLPNQDAIKFQECQDGTTVLAVADGHGSPKCFRSDTGSQLAVDTAIRVATEFLKARSADPASDFEAAARQQLPYRIAAEWQQLAQSDFESKPFTPIELDRVERELGVGFKEKLTDPNQILMAYGSTLLMVAMTQTFIIYLQLGDGDILEVSDKENHVKHPLPEDSTLIANETTSLCMKNASEMFRFGFREITSEPPALILVSTDGYSNSFSTAADFQKVGTDLLKIVQEEGLDSINSCLAGWLEEASKAGSGDDVTLGIICRADVQAAKQVALPTPPKAVSSLILEEKTTTSGASNSGVDK